MKKYLLAILCSASLGAAQFEHQVTVTPTSELGKKEYLAEIEITKISEEGRFVLAKPKLICLEGEQAELRSGDFDQGDGLIVSVLIPENNPNIAETFIVLKEHNEFVLWVDSNFKVIR